MTRLRSLSLNGGLLISHLAALVFGLVGLLIMLPNPDLWAHDPRAIRVFDWSMDNAGATHIVLGAVTMFVLGVSEVGWRKTVIFAAVSTVLSLGFELFGTGTGWPFGNYQYTDFLGYKVLDRVPWTIPLSWFYMGFASYLLGSVLSSRLAPGRRGVWSVLLGAWLLTAWDLVLDPAMAHETLRVQFWIWDETGPYFGMPLKNFAGWSITGLVFMALSRALWGDDPPERSLRLRIPLVVYLANMAFAMVISAAVGLWAPIAIAAVIGVAPAVAASNLRLKLVPLKLRAADNG